MRLQLQCYSGRKADERPIRFQLDRDLMVEEDDEFFKVTGFYIALKAARS